MFFGETKNKHNCSTIVWLLMKLTKNVLFLGCIEFDEFLNMMKRKMKENENSLDDVRAAFKVFDQDGDG